MDCSNARELNLDGLRGRLSSELEVQLREHLSTCASCRDHALAERVLSEVLDARLPARRAAGSEGDSRRTGSKPPQRVARPAVREECAAPTLALAAAAAAMRR
jgi:predicted anti-sigma-YlaC factor YlaD